MKKICLLMILLVAFAIAGCSQHDASTTGNSNQAQATTSPGPDNSEITTSVDASGTRTALRSGTPVRWDSDSFDEVPDSLACGSASGMTGVRKASEPYAR